MRPKGSPEQLEWRRRRAIELLGQKQKPSQVAKELRCSIRAVQAWKQTYTEFGKKGLKRKAIPGRPVKMKAKQKESLVKILKEGALKSGYTTELWTAKRVTQVIRKRLKVKYHPNHVGKILIGLGWSWQKPKKVAAQRDEEKIRRWKRSRWPHIKKG